ncbi:MAG: class I SAM-dependent methyltransferase [Bacilli bacterium]|nr:class I SAM-dependent methyltransferase [Bacilli bacterium]
MNLKERNENMREFFNRKSDGYDEVHEKFMTTKNQLIDKLDINATKILDLGAGTGLELIHLYETRPNARTTAIDISESMLEKLKERSFADKVETICGDFFDVNFGSGYDAVISTSALHHFLKDTKLKLYKKIYESLGENGEFLNADKIALSNEAEEESLEDYNLHKDERPHIDTPLSIEHEVEILLQAGFKDVKVYETEKEDYRLIKAKK